MKSFSVKPVKNVKTIKPIKAIKPIPPLGSGGRFKSLVKKVKSPALAAFIGRKKYGKTAFQAMALKGKLK